MRCEAEQCPFWGGDGCICDAMDIDDADRTTMKKKIGWPYDDEDEHEVYRSA